MTALVCNAAIQRFGRLIPLTTQSGSLCQVLSANFSPLVGSEPQPTHAALDLIPIEKGPPLARLAVRAFVFKDGVLMTNVVHGTSCARRG